MAESTNRSSPDATAQETATRWTQLDKELRMLCRSVSRPAGWSPETITTFVRLPGDHEYAQAMGTLCRRLAAEYGLDLTLRRSGADWRVSFSRPNSSGLAEQARSMARKASPLREFRGAVARCFAAVRSAYAMTADRAGRM